MLIPIPSYFVNSIISGTVDTMSGLWPIVILLASIPLAFYILRSIKNLIKLK